MKQLKEQDLNINLQANASKITNSSCTSKSRQYNSENLLNEIRQIVYSLIQPKEVTKKVYNNKIKSKQI